MLLFQFKLVYTHACQFQFLLYVNLYAKWCMSCFDSFNVKFYVVACVNLCICYNARISMPVDMLSLVSIYMPNATSTTLYRDCCCYLLYVICRLSYVKSCMPTPYVGLLYAECYDHFYVFEYDNRAGWTVIIYIHYPAIAITEKRLLSCYCGFNLYLNSQLL
jgi:hypothetical protein